MKALSVGLLAWDYPPSASGLAVAAREIAESLVEAGQDVRVLSLDRSGRETINGVDVVGCMPKPKSALTRIRRLGGVGHLAAPAAFLGAVRKAHLDRPFDLIEATNWYAPAALLHRLTNIPVVTRHSTPAVLTGIADDPKGTWRPLRSRIDAGFAARIEAYSAQASGGWISNTEAHAATIIDLYGLPELPSESGRHAVIGLSLPDAKRRRGGHADYPCLPGERVRLLFVGRAERRKGFDLLMGALERLSDATEYESLPPFILRIVGVEQRDMPNLPEAALSSLVLTGRLDEHALEREYAACHGVLAPSRYESFGLVYQEALAFGRPVVALAEDASAREFIGATGAGILADPSTPEALAEAIARLLSSGEVRQALRTRAIAAAGRFDRASLGAETLALYRRVLTPPDSLQSRPVRLHEPPGFV